MYSNDYWQRRTLANQAKADKIAKSYSKKLQALHKQIYAELETYLTAIQADIDAGKIISRTDLWNSKRYIDLRNKIRSLTNTLAGQQIDILEADLDAVFTQTIGDTMDYFRGGKVDQLETNTQKNKLLTSEFAGKNYSERVWNNTNQLADNLENKLCSMILTGRDIKKELMYELNVSYHAADRLVRTETAHIYTEAAKEGYRQANITQVKFIAENDCCDECEKYRNKIFDIDKAPLLPRHCFASAV